MPEREMKKRKQYIVDFLTGEKVGNPKWNTTEVVAFSEIEVIKRLKALNDGVTRISLKTCPRTLFELDASYPVQMNQSQIGYSEQVLPHFKYKKNTAV